MARQGVTGAVGAGWPDAPGVASFRAIGGRQRHNRGDGVAMTRQNSLHAHRIVK